jgi:plasmid stabilization system protein ParE
VLWHAEARADIISIFDYFAERDLRVAALLVERIEQTAIALAKHDTGRPGRMPRLKEKSVPRTRYVLAYRVRRRDIVILHVIHTSQNWTASNWPEQD